jgi:uncharacterized protein (TIRG00374 family)
MKRVVSLAVSLLLLTMMYWHIDVQGLLQALQHSDLLWMGISLAMVVPITLITAWRLQQLAPARAQLGWAEANRLILAASVLNMVLPSKMGDIAKAYFMRDRGQISGALALSLVVFEKTCDLLALLFWCVLGLVLYPQQGVVFVILTSSIALGLLGGVLLVSSRAFAQRLFTWGRVLTPKMLSSALEDFQTAWDDMHGYVWRDKIQLVKITATSIFLWFLHLLQIWFFILALKAWVPFVADLALSPLAILAGLLPFTFAGVGTRDAALILFYRPFFDAPTAAALGLLCTSRYLLPALAGLPFLGQYVSTRQRVR